MPNGPLHPCRGSGCRILTNAPDHFCEAHRRAWRQKQDATRPHAAARGYGHAWAALRARILKRDPSCRWPDCQELSVDVDHIVSKRKGGTDADSNLRGLCHRHHSHRTVTEDGGFGR
jgi:5-methylcytosine-specific restriction protein A